MNALNVLHQLEVEDGVDVDVAIKHGTGGDEPATRTHGHCGQGQTVRHTGAQQERRRVPQLQVGQRILTAAYRIGDSQQTTALALTFARSEPASLEQVLDCWALHLHLQLRQLGSVFDTPDKRTAVLGHAHNLR